MDNKLLETHYIYHIPTKTCYCSLDQAALAFKMTEDEVEKKVEKGREFCLRAVERFYT